MALIIGLIALVPRTVAQGSFITVDEATHWFGRAEKFLQAVRAGDWARTNLIGHPGVSTMWLGATGIWLHEFLAQLGLVDPQNLAQHRALVRLPVGIVTALCVALAYPLLRRLFGGRVALLAALLWATEPFLIAHSQLLHTDALLTSFVNLALLLALVAFRFDAHAAQFRALRPSLLIASGVAGGLALLTKSSALVLLPLVGLIALLAHWRNARTKNTSTFVVIARAGVALLAWLGVVVIVWYALWPAAWTHPLQTALSMYTKAVDEGGSPHGWGNFFLGRAVADPGPFFYLAATALRLTPWTLIGLLAALFFVRKHAPRERAPLVVLLVFVLVFGGGMSVLPKKFDRYILPIFPALDILAAFGLLALLDFVRRLIARPRQSSGSRFLVLGSLFLILFNVVWFHPYEISYYNQLLGGGRAARRVIPIGWGEGYEQVGAFISAQPDGCAKPVAAWFREVLAPFVCVKVVPLDAATRPGEAGYAVLYVDQIQRNDAPEATQMLLGKAQPAHTVRIHGIDYAYVYKLVPPVQHPVAAAFGSAIQLRGYDLHASAVRKNGALLLNLHWAAQSPVAEPYSVFVHVLNAGGEKIGQIDLPLVGPDAPDKHWQPGAYTSWNVPLPVRPDLAPGTYWLAVGVYNPADFARLPLRAPMPPNAPDDGANALLLGPITLP